MMLVGGTDATPPRTGTRQWVMFRAAPEIGSPNYYLWHPDLKLGVWYIWEYNSETGTTWRKG